MTGTRLRTLQIGMRWSGGAGSGGLDRVFTSLVDGLPGEGVEARGVVEGPADVAVLTNGRVRAFVDEPSGLPQRLAGARRAIAAEVGAVDLVASHFALYAAPALDKLRGLPLVSHFHGPWAGESLRANGDRFGAIAKRHVEHRVYDASARVIVLSRAFAELAAQTYRVPEQRIRVVPGGIDLTRFPVDVDKAAARMRLGWPLDRPIVLSVRRLSPRMGLQDLLTAAAQVVVRVPDALFVIAGEGAMKATLEARAESLGIVDRVRFTGFLPEGDLPSAYAAADISVAPSRDLEGFGLVVLESLASGTPVIVSRVGGMPEIVEDFSPDLIFPPGDAAALADKLLGALRGDIRLPDADACRRHAERYAMPLMIQRTAAIYREVMSSGTKA